MKDTKSGIRQEVQDAIKQCHAVIQASTHAIEKFGKYLVEKTISYPNFIEEITLADNSISLPWLSMVRNVGHGLVYAQLTPFHYRPGVRRLSNFPIEQQIKLWKDGVMVLRKNGSNGYIKTIVGIPALTASDTALAFHGHGIRDEEDQRVELSKVKFMDVRKFIIEKKAVRILKKCVLSHSEVVQIATGVLTKDDLIRILTKSARKAA